MGTVIRGNIERGFIARGDGGLQIGPGAKVRDKRVQASWLILPSTKEN